MRSGSPHGEAHHDGIARPSGRSFATLPISAKQRMGKPKRSSVGSSSDRFETRAQCLVAAKGRTGISHRNNGSRFVCRRLYRRKFSRLLKNNWNGIDVSRSEMHEVSAISFRALWYALAVGMPSTEKRCREQQQRA